MEGTKIVCAKWRVRYEKSEELATVEMGCWKMPCKGSMYCHYHKILQIQALGHKDSVAENMSVKSKRERKLKPT